MIKKWIPFLTLLWLSSCTVIGFTDDYKKLYPEQQRNIVPLVSFADANPEMIYKVNGLKLREELKKHPKSLVYIFTNGCTSSYCLPMSTYEKYARENGYQLFLVMNGYGNLKKTTEQRSEVFTAPLYAMDSDYYGSNIKTTYSKHFENDLLGQPHKIKNEWKGNLYFFERDQLTTTALELPPL